MIKLALAITIHLLPGDWNGIHPGIKYVDNGFYAAAFYNSEEKLSLAVGREFDLNNHWTIEVGLATGYSGAKAVPTLRVKRDKLFIAPAYDVTAKAAGLVVGVEF